jgi:hypothetical protein
MASGSDEFEDLTREIRNLLKDNERFLKRVLEEDFEPEEEVEAEDSIEDFEEL